MANQYDSPTDYENNDFTDDEDIISELPYNYDGPTGYENNENSRPKPI